MSELVWVCAKCNNGNLRREAHCLHCGEAQPPYARLEEIRSDTPLGLELLELSTPSAAKSRKRPSKGQKPPTAKQLYKLVNWNEFSDEIVFTVMGKPIAKERPRLGRGGTYTPKKTKDYESDVRNAAQEAMQGKPPLTGLIQLSMVIWRADGRQADVDNIVKSVMDGMQKGGVYRNDSQVAELEKVRVIRYAAHECVLITIREFAQFPVQKKVRKPRLEERIAA
jgi:Holliday junction resolvase RusA-like endonuclease